MTDRPTPYEMPSPWVDLDPNEGPVARLAEMPPAFFRDLAMSLMDAEPDTSECAICTATIGNSLVPVPDRDHEMETWLTPWLIYDAGGKPAAVCEDCAETPDDHH